MTFSQFIDKWLGKKADWDGAYAGQCVDLFRYYCHEVMEISQPAGVWGAANFWTNFESDPILVANFTKIPNTPTGVPLNGDVMIWDFDAGGGFGHIAIFIEGNESQFTSFDQNFPTLSKCTKTVHNYINVYGWLRPKTPTPPEPGEPMPTDLQVYLGVTSDAEAKARLKEHLGEEAGKCDYGNDSGTRGGFLGSARRRIKELELQPVPPTNPEQPPVVIGWEANGLQVKLGDKTWNYGKKA